MNNAFSDAASQLADRMFLRDGSGGLFRSADSGDNSTGLSFRDPIGGALAGFGLPVGATGGCLGPLVLVLVLVLSCILLVVLLPK